MKHSLNVISGYNKCYMIGFLILLLINLVCLINIKDLLQELFVLQESLALMQSNLQESNDILDVLLFQELYFLNETNDSIKVIQSFLDEYEAELKDYSQEDKDILIYVGLLMVLIKIAFFR